MKVRRVVFWLHLVAGVFAATVVLTMSVTGVALTYQKQLTERADQVFWPPAAPPDAGLLPIDALISRVAQAHTDAQITGITVNADTAVPALVTVATGPNLFVNRYTGEIRELGSSSTREFFRLMTTWHRYVGGTGDNRALGKAITGASNLAFLFIVASGLYLWWPRNWGAVRAVTRFKRGLSGRRRDFNWHNVVGFWTAIPLFVVVLSATVISYPWASNIAYRIAGDTPPVRSRSSARAVQNEKAADIPTLDPAQLDPLFQSASEQAAGWRTISLRLPTTEDENATFTIYGGYRGQPQLRSTLILDRNTAVVRDLATFSDQSAGQRLRSWLRFTHTGEFYGMAGQTIGGIASLAAVVLVVTGLSLSFRRFLGWITFQRRTRRARAQSGLLTEEPS